MSWGELFTLSVRVHDLASAEAPADIAGQQRHFAAELPALRERLEQTLRDVFSERERETLRDVLAGMASDPLPCACGSTAPLIPSDGSGRGDGWGMCPCCGMI